MNERRFENKVVLVTGGTSGIGRATALAFAREGAQVIVAARREELGRQVVGEMERYTAGCTFVRTDVRKPEDIENLFRIIKETYGRLDCAYNNAGIGLPLKRTAKTSLEEWEEIMNTNVRGVWLCMKHEISMMLKQGGGAIVNCSSILGLRGEDGMSLYVASKHAVLGLTRAAALEVSHRGVRVNAVCPGFVDTPMIEGLYRTDPQRILSLIPLKRVGIPNEIASAVLFLCSSAASFITGKEIVIAGGQGIRA
ncbi:MAG: glucose 1-dehydrogenase [Syntrophales bacterium]|nr:glucose 1-dehydrogenase [Syntrophales bacterium]